MKKCIWIIIPVFVATIVVVLMKTVFFLGYVPTSSMEPTLKKGSLIFGIRVFDELEIGDIIVFKKDGKLLVKRIAAKAGETITINKIEYTVPEGCYFVLGDNKNCSIDSRYWEEKYVEFNHIIVKLIG